MRVKSLEVIAVVVCGALIAVAFREGVVSFDFQALKRLLHLESEPPVAESTPTPTPTPAPKKRLAAEGTYYLLQRLSIVSESGVYGLAPGTKLILIEAHKNGTLRVSDGTQEMDVVPEALTNDLDLADLAARNDAESQARIQGIQAREKALADRRDAAEAARRDRGQSAPEYPQAQTIAAVAGPPRNPLDRGAYNYHTSRSSYPFIYSHGNGRPYSRVYYYDQWGKRYFVGPEGSWNYY